MDRTYLAAARLPAKRSGGAFRVRRQRGLWSSDGSGVLRAMARMSGSTHSDRVLTLRGTPGDDVMGSHRTGCGWAGFACDAAPTTSRVGVLRCHR